MVFNHTRAVFDVVDPIGGGKIIAITTYTVDALISLKLFKLIFPSFLRLVIPIFTETHQIFKSTFFLTSEPCENVDKAVYTQDTQLSIIIQLSCSAANKVFLVAFDQSHIIFLNSVEKSRLNSIFSHIV